MEKQPAILVVDDESSVTQVLKRILEAEGYSVTIAGNGYMALAEIAKSPPDLILLDINMPGMNGYQVLENMAKQDIRIPVIMLTAVVDVFSVDKSIELGADDYVRKPFHSRELIARVKVKLRRANRNQT